jgi:hypothetical protein
MMACGLERLFLAVELSATIGVEASSELTYRCLDRSTSPIVLVIIIRNIVSTLSGHPGQASQLMPRLVLPNLVFQMQTSYRSCISA